MIISTSADAFEQASFYKRFRGEAFLRWFSEWGTSMPNFAFVDGWAVMQVEAGGSYLLFLNDKNLADQLIQFTDKTPVFH